MPDLARVIADVVAICRGRARRSALLRLRRADRVDPLRRPHFLCWAGIPGGPAFRARLHPRRPRRPGEAGELGRGQRGATVLPDLEHRRVRSVPAVRTEIAHGVIHLHLILAGEQRLRGRGTSERPDDPEEVRADAAAVALGFGKLMPHGRGLRGVPAGQAARLPDHRPAHAGPRPGETSSSASRPVTPRAEPSGTARRGARRNTCRGRVVHLWHDTSCPGALRGQ